MPTQKGTADAEDSGATCALSGGGKDGVLLHDGSQSRIDNGGRLGIAKGSRHRIKKNAAILNGGELIHASKRRSLPRQLITRA